MLNRGAPVALLAVGMTLVIATKGIDLSVGAVMAICGAVPPPSIVAGDPLIATLLLALGVGPRLRRSGTAFSSPSSISSRSSPRWC